VGGEAQEAFFNAPIRFSPSLPFRLDRELSSAVADFLCTHTHTHSRATTKAHFPYSVCLSFHLTERKKAVYREERAAPQLVTDFFFF
jgi:hypothetical protein